MLVSASAVCRLSTLTSVYGLIKQVSGSGRIATIVACLYENYLQATGRSVVQMRPQICAWFFAAILLAGMLGGETHWCARICSGWTPDLEIHQWEQLNLATLLPRQLRYALTISKARKANAPDLALSMGSDVLEAYISIESQKELIAGGLGPQRESLMYLSCSFDHRISAESMSTRLPGKRIISKSRLLF